MDNTCKYFNAFVKQWWMITEADISNNVVNISRHMEVYTWRANFFFCYTIRFRLKSTFHFPTLIYPMTQQKTTKGYPEKTEIILI